MVAQASDSEDWDKTRALYLYAITRISAVSLIAAGTVLLSSATLARLFFDSSEMSSVFGWMGAAIPAFALTWIHAHFFQGIGKISHFQVFQNLGVNALFLSCWGGWRFIHRDSDPDPRDAAMIFFGACWACAAMASLIWKMSVPRSASGNSATLSVNWAQEISPFFGMVLLNQLLLWTPQTILGIYWPESQVGVYNAAFRVANLVSLVLMGVNSVVFPRFASLYAKGEHEKLQRLAQQSAKLILVACLPFLALLVLFPDNVLAVFGAEFRAGALSLQIVALGQLINAATGSVGGLLNMTGNQKSAFIGLLTSYTIMLVLCFLIVPVWGSHGAAAAQATSISITMVMFSRISMRTLGFSPFSIRAWFPKAP